MASSLSTAQLAIYIVLSIPTLYTLFTHYRRGLMGWLCLFIFCGLQIVGSAMTMTSESSTGSLISSVGLSPLLLCTEGILHEARVYRSPGLNQKLEWIFVILSHIFVVAGVIMVAMGSASLAGTDPKPSDQVVIKVGIVILALFWLVLVGYAGMSLASSHQTKSNTTHRAGTVLLYAVCIALVFVGIRVLYSLVSLTTGAAALNPTTGTLAVRVVLGFLPSLIAALIFIVAGIYTRDVSRLVKDTYQNTEYEKPHSRSQNEWHGESEEI